MIVLQSESAEYPKLVDTESSPAIVYVRTDIKEHTREDEVGNRQTYYTYTETQYTREEYERHKLTQLVADLAEITLFGGVRGA